MERFLERFLCCCVNNPGGNAEQVGMTGELFGTTQEAAFPTQSSQPHFPQGQEALQRQLQEGRSPKELAMDSYASGELQAHGSVNSARSATSAGSSMSAEEKEREKARLQRLVKDFAKEAVTGIAVNLVNAETARKSPHFFQMDRYLTVFSLKPKDGSTAESSVQDFNVKDLTSIYKGMEVSMKAPSLGSVASSCVGLDTNRADRRLFFHFDDNYERDKFYTCLKILRMSVDINRPG
mmetsp:Transcript_94599/g.149604  ORF Transcript_94599/g.149604 Transcript_94599/m.149604 type:complete len:237 (-) Transcript_94599:112-822(-)